MVSVNVSVSVVQCGCKPGECVRMPTESVFVGVSALEDGVGASGASVSAIPSS